MSVGTLIILLAVFPVAVTIYGVFLWWEDRRIFEESKKRKKK